MRFCHHTALRARRESVPPPPLLPLPHTRICLCYFILRVCLPPALRCASFTTTFFLPFTFTCLTVPLCLLPTALCCHSCLPCLLFWLPPCAYLTFSVLPAFSPHYVIPLLLYLTHCRLRTYAVVWFNLLTPCLYYLYYTTCGSLFFFFFGYAGSRLMPLLPLPVAFIQTSLLPLPTCRYLLCGSFSSIFYHRFIPLPYSLHLFVWVCLLLAALFYMPHRTTRSFLLFVALPYAVALHAARFAATACTHTFAFLVLAFPFLHCTFTHCLPHLYTLFPHCMPALCVYLFTHCTFAFALPPFCFFGLSLPPPLLVRLCLHACTLARFALHRTHTHYLLHTRFILFIWFFYPFYLPLPPFTTTHTTHLGSYLPHLIYSCLPPPAFALPPPPPLPLPAHTATTTCPYATLPFAAVCCWFTARFCLYTVPFPTWFLLLPSLPCLHTCLYHAPHFTLYARTHGLCHYHLRMPLPCPFAFTAIIVFIAFYTYTYTAFTFLPSFTFPFHLSLTLAPLPFSFHILLYRICTPRILLPLPLFILGSVLYFTAFTAAPHTPALRSSSLRCYFITCTLLHGLYTLRTYLHRVPLPYFAAVCRTRCCPLRVAYALRRIFVVAGLLHAHTFCRWLPAAICARTHRIYRRGSCPFFFTADMPPFPLREHMVHITAASLRVAVRHLLHFTVTTAAYFLAFHGLLPFLQFALCLTAAIHYRLSSRIATFITDATPATALYIYTYAVLPLVLVLLPYLPLPPRTTILIYLHLLPLRDCATLYHTTAYGLYVPCHAPFAHWPPPLLPAFAVPLRYTHACPLPTLPHTYLCHLTCLTFLGHTVLCPTPPLPVCLCLTLCPCLPLYIYTFLLLVLIVVTTPFCTLFLFIWFIYHTPFTYLQFLSIFLYLYALDLLFVCSWFPAHTPVLHCLYTPYCTLLPALYSTTDGCTRRILFSCPCPFLYLHTRRAFTALHFFT